MCLCPRAQRGLWLLTLQHKRLSNELKNYLISCSSIKQSWFTLKIKLRESYQEWELWLGYKITAHEGASS